MYGHYTGDDLLRWSSVFMLEARGGLLCSKSDVSVFQFLKVK